MKARKLIAIAVASFLGFAAPAVAEDTFVELTGITGDATDATYRDWFEVTAFSWGGALGEGDIPEFDELVIERPAGDVNNGLFRAHAEGRTIDSLTLVVKRPFQTEGYLVVELGDAVISSMERVATQGDDQAVDRFGLRFQSIDLSHRASIPSSPLLAAPVTRGYDIATDTAR